MTNKKLTDLADIGGGLSGDDLLLAVDMSGPTSRKATVGAIADFTVGRDVELAAIAGLTSAANTVPYFTGSGSAALATITAAARTFLAAVDAASQRTALGLGTAATTATTAYATSTQGTKADNAAAKANNLSDLASTSTALTNLGAQPLDSDLTAIAAISGVRGDVLYRNATSWANLAAGTAGQALQTKGSSADPVWADFANGQTTYASSGHTNITIGGGGTIAGTYYRVGKIVFFQIEATLGTSFGIGGTSSYLGTPTAAISGWRHNYSVQYLDFSANQWFPGSSVVKASQEFYLYADLVYGTSVLSPFTTNVFPFTFDVGDEIVVTGWYPEP